MKDIELVQAARRVQKNAYAPYSGFQVGAALLTKQKQVFLGVNVENAAYGDTLCAERNAVAAAITAGQREFLKIAIVSESADFLVPCGTCRQVLAEFSEEIEVIMANNKDGYIKKSIKELLPLAFGTDYLMKEGTDER